MLKTAEELRIKGLAEVSWRSEGEGSWRSVEGAGSGATDDMDSDSEPPPTKKLKQPPQHSQHTPSHSHDQQHYDRKPHPASSSSESHYSAPKSSHQSEQHFNPKVSTVVGNLASRNDYNVSKNIVLFFLKLLIYCTSPMWHDGNCSSVQGDVAALCNCWSFN